MKLEVQRFSSQSNSTLGMLFDVTGTPKFLCYTLEDEFRENKVSGETRIPSGTYNVLRVVYWLEIAKHKILLKMDL